MKLAGFPTISDHKVAKAVATEAEPPQRLNDTLSSLKTACQDTKSCLHALNMVTGTIGQREKKRVVPCTWKSTANCCTNKCKVNTNCNENPFSGTKYVRAHIMSQHKIRLRKRSFPRTFYFVEEASNSKEIVNSSRQSNQWCLQPFLKPLPPFFAH